MRAKSLNGNLVHGANYLVRGAKMLPHPRLRAFVLIPLLINLIIFATLLGIAFSYISDWIDGMMAAIPEWLSFLEYILWPIVGLAASLFTGYLFTGVAIMIASPFNALLAEKAEELVTGQPVDALEGLGAALASIPRGIARELRKLWYYLPMFAFVLLCSLLPVVNAVSPLLWFGLGAWMMSIQYLDYPMDNHQLSFADVKEAVRSRRLSSLGFGGVVALMTGIPILNFFVIPSAVVGATLYWCEELRGPRSPRARH